MIAPEECPHCGDDNINRDGARWRCERCWNWFGDSRPRAAVTTSPTKPYTNIITMIEMHPFVEATKTKLRFYGAGQLAAEDLWDLPLNKLNEMAVELDGILAGPRKSFLPETDKKQNPEQKQQALRLEVLKLIIEIKLAEQAAKRADSVKSARRQFLQGLLEKKRIDQLESLSAEEIEKELAALEP